MKPILFLIIPLALYGFTLSRAQDGTTDAPDPCALLTKAEIENTFGELKEAPKPDTGVQKEKECHYTNKDGNYLVFRIYAAERWDLQKGINSENNPTTLPDLGDEAFWVKKGTDKEIYVKKGTWILEIDGSADSEKLKALAALAAGKMK